MARPGVRRSAVVVVVGLVVAGLALVVLDRDDPAPALAGPSTDVADTRLVGANGLVVAVPEKWTTEIEQGSYCGPTKQRVVHFFVSTRGPIGSCARTIGTAYPPAQTLTVREGIQAPSSLASTEPDGEVAGMPYYLVDDDEEASGGARTLIVPAARVSFEIGADSSSEADAILRTIRATPAGTTTVGLTQNSAGEPAVRGDLVQRTYESQSPGLPGRFVGTHPPLGSPVPIGSTVTLDFTRGYLGIVVGSDVLQAHGWTIGAATMFDPPITRVQAFELAPSHDGSGHRYSYGILSGGDRGTYLRTLNGRLVWLVTQQDPGAPTVRITAIDARTGTVVADRVFGARHW